MGHALTRDRLLYRALLASLALHLVLLALIPPLASLEGRQNVELLSFVRVEPVRIETAKPHLQRAATAPVRAALVHARPVHAVAPHVVAVAHVHAVVARPHESAPQQGSLQSGSVHAAPGATAMPVQNAVTPQPTPTGATKEAPVGAVMPLGAEEPVPVLDPSVRASLLALGVHVTLTIGVDAEGHTQRVAFTPPIDANVEERIRTLLASASWDPAVCGGGVTCAGQAIIRL